MFFLNSSLEISLRKFIFDKDILRMIDFLEQTPENMIMLVSL